MVQFSIATYLLAAQEESNNQWFRSWCAWLFRIGQLVSACLLAQFLPICTLLPYVILLPILLLQYALAVACDDSPQLLERARAPLRETWKLFFVTSWSFLGLSQRQSSFILWTLWDGMRSLICVWLLCSFYPAMGFFHDLNPAIPAVNLSQEFSSVEHFYDLYNSQGNTSMFDCSAASLPLYVDCAFTDVTQYTTCKDNAPFWFDCNALTAFQVHSWKLYYMTREEYDPGDAEPFVVIPYILMPVLVSLIVVLWVLIGVTWSLYQQCSGKASGPDNKALERIRRNAAWMRTIADYKHAKLEFKLGAASADANLAELSSILTQREEGVKSSAQAIKTLVEQGQGDQVGAACEELLVIANGGSFDSLEPHAVWSFYFDAGFILMDMATDLNNVVQYFRTFNYLFAVFTMAVFVHSIWHQFRDGAWKTGGPLRLLKEARRCANTGTGSDMYMEIVHMERSHEAFPSLMMSLFALPYVTRDRFAVVSLVFSILSSFKVMLSFLYSDCDLGMYALYKQFEETLDMQKSSMELEGYELVEPRVELRPTDDGAYRG